MARDAMAVDAETERQLAICDACRYCEGLCAVFPALERRAVRTDGDVVQLAHLCHDCRACYEVCMYAPPHTFGVNLPQLLAARRDDTIRSLGARATPAVPAGPRRPGTLFALVAAVSAVAIGLATAHGSPSGGPAGSPYRVLSRAYLLIGSGTVAVVALGGFALGGHRYWRAVGGRTRDLFQLRPLVGACADAGTLAHLRGPASVPCATDLAGPRVRRMVHQSLVVGLALTVVATIAAAILEHGFGAMPPYGWVSVPVIAGGSGGVLLLGSTTALRFLDRRRDPAPGSPVMLVRDAALLDVLGALAVTGLATVLLRSTPAGPVSLAIHLVVVWGAILVAAWSKLAHAQYRFLALIKDRIERVNGEWLNDARRNGEQVEGGDRESASAQRP